MKRKLQFGGWLLAAGIGVAMMMPCATKAEPANGAAQNKESNRPPATPKPAKQESRPPQRQNQEGRQTPPDTQRPPVQPRGADRPNHANRVNPPTPAANSGNRENRPPNAIVEPRQGTNSNGNRPPNAAVHPRDLSPEARKNLPQYERLAPQQKREMIERAQVWNRLTPEQRSHIKNDVMPKWNQLEPNRQRAIRQRLGVLQNMPESAKNQHLNDPNFTRGMNGEDKAMLRDLSHMHVGAPDPPSE